MSWKYLVKCYTAALQSVWFSYSSNGGYHRINGWIYSKCNYYYVYFKRHPKDPAEIENFYKVTNQKASDTGFYSNEKIQ